jgi:catechol 2,3-dioxygenase-like lactoylglutathione lyase family enzyme
MDHLALRVVDPEPMAAFLSEHCAMERGESAEGFTVLAPAGGRTKLFLFEADEPPAPGVLERVILRVSDLKGALGRLPRGLDVERADPEVAAFEGPEGLGLGLTSVYGGVDYDIDQIVLRVMDPDETTIAMAELGFVPRGSALHVADKQVRLRPGIRSAGEREPLSHIGVLVESVDAVRDQALRGGLQIDELTLAPNELGVYVRGPERIRVEYAERR